MTLVIEEIQQALEEQDIEKVYEHYHHFFDHFNKDNEEDIKDLADLSEYSFSIGFYEEAKRGYQLLTEIEPEESMWTILFAELLVMEGEVDQALSILYDIPETDENYPGSLIVQALAYRDEKDYELAEKKLMKAKSLVPDNELVDFYIGTVLFEMGSYERSAVFLKRYIDAVPEDNDESERARELYVEAMLQSGNDEPLSEYIGGESIDGVSTSLLSLMASNETLEGNYEKALEYYLQILEREEENPEAILQVIHCYLLLKQEGKAKEYAKKWIEFDEYNDEAHRIYGEIELATGNREIALQQLKTAVEINPDSILNIQLYVEALNEEEDFEDSLAFMNQLEVKEEPEVLYLMAKTYEAMEDYANAFHYYQQVFEIEGHTIDFLEDYVRFMIEEGRKDLASLALKEGLKEDPYNPEFIRFSFILEE